MRELQGISRCGEINTQPDRDDGGFGRHPGFYCKMPDMQISHGMGDAVQLIC